ncbi:hypothetical protein [Sphingomonas sp. S6]|jgi:hypothetical protein|nr:hypothetical protein [uncultured Sphingomonas sp.]
MNKWEALVEIVKATPARWRGLVALTVVVTIPLPITALVVVTRLLN